VHGVNQLGIGLKNEEKSGISIDGVAITFAKMQSIVNNFLLRVMIPDATPR